MTPYSQSVASTETLPQALNNASETVNLLDIAVSFLVQWRLFLLCAVSLFVLAAAFILRIKPLFEANASILPQSHEQANSVEAYFSGRAPGDIFIGLLGSRSVADRVIDQTHLLETYKTTDRERARAMLAGQSSFAEGRDTMVTVTVRDGSGQQAMRIANAYLVALEEQRHDMIAREADTHSRFFEQQIDRESEQLAAAEQQLAQAQERSGVVLPEAQTSMSLGAVNGTRSQIEDLQVQLSSVLLGESEQAPKVRQLRAQIAQLQGHLASLQSDSSAALGVSVKRQPELNLEIARLQRVVHLHEGQLTSLSSQYETSRLNASDTGAAFLIVDRAVVPDAKAYPPRRNLLMFALGFSCFFGLLAVVVKLLVRRIASDPGQSERRHRLRQSLPSRGSHRVSNRASNRT